MPGSLTHRGLLLALLLGLVLAQQLFSVPGSSPLRQALQNSLHAPWFFVVTFVLCVLFRPLGLWRRLLIAGVLACLLAAGTELLQTLVLNRSASVGDLQRNLVGAGFALLVSTLVLPGAAGFSWPGVPRSIAAVLALLALTVYSFWPVYSLYQLKRDRFAQLPALIDIQDPRLSQYVRVSPYSHLTEVRLDGSWPAYIGREVLRVQFGDSEYPTLYVEDLGQHWHTYDDLVIELFVPGDEPIELTIAVQYQGSYGTNSYRELVAQPGANVIDLPRDAFVPDGATGIKVRDLLLYTTNSFAGRSLLVGAMYLR